MISIWKKEKRKLQRQAVKILHVNSLILKIQRNYINYDN